MMFKVESFTTKVKRNLRVIVLISSHEKEMGAEKQRLSETEIYILDPMTAQLTHETRLTSIALSTTSFPIIFCAGHLPAQNNDGHMF